MHDLWPDDIGHVSKISTPATILKEQASLLGQKTGNLILAEVVLLEQDFGRSEEFNYAFLIVAPTLNDYRYRLFTISHDITLYPVKFHCDADLTQQIGSSESVGGKDYLNALLRGEPPALVAKSEDELLEILGRILGAEKTRRVIAAILSMVSYGDDKELPF